jgi:hypothetical protein
MSLERQTRILGLDVLKFCTLLAITILHVNEFIFFSDVFPLGNKSPLWHLFSYYARIFALGGQVLVSIIYFLFGFTQKSKKELLKISFFALIGQILLGYAFKIVEWDIYSFIFVSNILIATIPLFFKQNTLALIVSFIVLWISPGQFSDLLPPESPLSLLTGQFYLSSSGSWPLLPWFFLATFFYQFGLLLKNRNLLIVWRRWEIFFWIIAFIISIPKLGFYYHLPIGPNFYHFAFYQESLTFFSNFTPFLFLGRISLIDHVQRYLSSKMIVQLISKSYWNQHLGLTYMSSILYLSFGMGLRDFFLEHPLFFDLFFVGVMPVSELFSRLVIMLKMNKKYWIPRYHRPEK